MGGDRALGFDTLPAAPSEHALVPCTQHKDRVTWGKGEGLSFLLETHLLISNPLPCPRPLLPFLTMAR